MQQIAKDPIDFIRGFRFATFTSQPGSTAGPTRKEVALTICLMHPEHQMSSRTAYVNIPKAGGLTMDVIADYLANAKDFQVLPYAMVTDYDNAIQINLLVSNPFVELDDLKADLDGLYVYMQKVKQLVESGNGRVLTPSYDRERISNSLNSGSNGGYPGGPTIGQSIPQGSNRTPQNYGGRNQPTTGNANKSNF